MFVTNKDGFVTVHQAGAIENYFFDNAMGQRGGLPKTLASQWQTPRMTGEIS